MLKKTSRVDLDEYGMLEIHTISVQLDVGTAAEEDSAEFWQYRQIDDVAELNHMLDAVERDVRAFWRSEGLPAEVEPSGFHPAIRAPKASWRERSWELWRHLVAARDAIAAGELHRAARLTWFIGSISAEIRLSRRHGRNAWSGRRSVEGGTDAAERKWADLKPMHQAWIARDWELSAETPSQRKRAKKIAEEWRGRDWNTIWCFLKGRKKIKKGSG